MATTNWTGNGNTTDWTNSGNWNNGVPANTDAAVIENTGGFQADIAAGESVVAQSLMLDTNGTLTNDGALGLTNGFSIDGTSGILLGYYGNASITTGASNSSDGSIVAGGPGPVGGPGYSDNYIVGDIAGNGSIAVRSGGNSLTLYGSLIDGYNDVGAGSFLQITGDLTTTNRTDINDGATLEIGGAVTDGTTISFYNNDAALNGMGTLVLDNPGAFSNSMTNPASIALAGLGTTLDLAGISSMDNVTAAYSGNQLTVTDNTTSSTYTFTVTGTGLGNNLAVYDDGNGGTDVSFSNEVWQQGISGDWQVGSSWTSGVAPVSTDNALIQNMPGLFQAKIGVGDIGLNAAVANAVTMVNASLVDEGELDVGTTLTMDTTSTLLVGYGTGGIVTAGGGIVNDGTVYLYGNSSIGTALIGTDITGSGSLFDQVGSNATIYGNVSQGYIGVSGTLDITGSLTNTGGWYTDIFYGASLEIGGATSSFVSFYNGTADGFGTLKIDDLADFTGSIGNASGGTTIEVLGTATATYNGNQLTIVDGMTTQTFTVNGDFTGLQVQTAADGANTDINWVPIVTITTTGSLTNNPAQTITGTGLAGSTIQLYDDTGMGPVAIGGPITVHNDGTWTTADLMTPITLSGDGQHVITAQDTDSFNQTGTSTSVIFTLDQDIGETPAVAFNASLIGSAGAGAVGFTISGLDGDLDQNGTLTFSDAGNVHTATVNIVNGVPQVTTVDLSSFNDGQVTATMSLTDTAGNTFATTTATTTLDQDIGETPAVAFNASLIGSAGAGAVGFTISGLDGDLDQNGTLTFSDAGNVHTATVNIVNGVPQVATVDLSSFNDGQVTATLSLTDTAGNTFATTTATTTLDQDIGETPAVAFNASLIGSAGAGAVGFTISGLDGDLDQNGTLTFSDAGNVHTATVNIVNGVPQVATVDLSSFNDGQVTATLSLTDTAGNTFATTTATTTLDQDIGETPAVAFNASLIGSAGAGAVGFTISGLDGDLDQNGTLTFSDAGNVHTATVNIVNGVPQVATVDLSSFNDGQVTATLSLTDTAGNTFATTTATTTLDQDIGETPAVAFNASLIGSAGAGAVGFTISGLDGDLDQNGTLTFSDAGNVHTATVNIVNGVPQVATVDLSSFNDGQVTATLSLTDTAGNTFATTTATTTLDQDIGETPAVAFNASLIGSAGAGAVGFTISGLDGDLDQNGTLTFSDAGNVHTATVNIVNGVPQVATVDLSSFNDGQVTATLSLTDTAGNTFATTTATTTLDQDIGETPAVAFNASLIGSAGAGAVGFTISGLDGDLDQNGTLTFSDAGNVHTATVNIVNGVPQVTTVDLSSFNDGQVTATMSLTDTAGNTFATTTATTTLDHTAPTESFTGVALTSDTGSNGHDFITSNGAVTFTGAVSDNGGVGIASVKVFNGATLLGTATINAGSWTLATTLAAGTYSALSVVATDLAGNSTTATNSQVIVVDQTAPTDSFSSVVLTSDTGSNTHDFITIDGRVTFSGAVADTGGAGLDTVKVYNGTTLLGTATVSGGTWTLATTLAAGTYGALNVVTTDLAGNTTSAAESQNVVVLKSPLPADFNGNGNSDMLFQANDGTVAVQLMNGLSIVSGGPLINPGSSWKVIGTGDFNGDGRSDILFQNTDGTVAEWQMNGTGTSGGGIVLNPGAAWRVVGSGDLNGDGKSDIVLQNADGSVAEWQMNGTGTTGGGLIANPGAGWKLVTIGDFDGDKKSDLLFQNTDGSVREWSMNGTSIVSNNTIGNPGAAWKVVAAGDLNADGNSDVVFQNTDGTVMEWLMNGSSVTGGGTVINPGAAWHVLGVRDFNGDGLGDLLLQNNDGSIAEWFMNGTSITGGGLVSSNLGATWKANGN